MAFCDSGNTILGPKLGIPQDLGLSGFDSSVLVAEVEIENEAAYLDAVMNADTTR